MAARLIKSTGDPRMHLAGDTETVCGEELTNDHFEAGVMCPDCASELVATVLTPAPPDAERKHEPGEHHDYGPAVCRVCGVVGMLVLSIEPQRAPDAPDDRSVLAWDDREAVARVEGISGRSIPLNDAMEDGG